MEAVKAIGWLVAAVAVVVAVMLGMQVGRLQRQLEVLEAEVGAMQAETSRTRGQLEQTRESGLPPAPVESRGVDAVTGSETVEEPPALVPPAPVLPAAPEPAPAPAEAPGEPTASSDGEPSEPSLESRVAQAQIGVIVDMAYGDFYAAAGLEGERLAEVQRALTDGFAREAQVRARAFADGTLPAREATAEQDAIGAEVRERLAEMLSAEELAAYDAYTAVADQALYTTLLAGQIAMLTSGVTEESRHLAAEVMGEELAFRLAEFDASDQPYTLGNYNAAQMVALENALAWMQDALDADQYDAVARFVDVAGAALGNMTAQ